MRFRTRPSLIARLRNLEDAAAWREFEASYRPFIRRVGVDAGVPKETLADMAQDVLLTVVRVIPRFAYDPSRGRFRSWLARIVRSRCCDLSRRRRRDARLKTQLAEWVLPGAKISEERDSAPHEEALRAAIDVARSTARPQTWDCFEQHVLKGRPAAEVASEVGTTVNAVYLNSMRMMNRVEAECRRLQDQGQGHESKAVSIHD
jgi:RNA polymerase sigma-70 factor (ECF subfamily)